MTELNEILAREAITQSVVAMGDLQASHTAIYLSLVFAYVSVAYLAGKDLSKPLLYLLSLMFISAAGFQVVTIVSLAQGSASKIAQLREFSSGIAVPVTSSTIWDNVAMWSLGIIAALVFMAVVRKDKDV